MGSNAAFCNLPNMAHNRPIISPIIVMIRPDAHVDMIRRFNMIKILMRFLQQRPLAFRLMKSLGTSAHPMASAFQQNFQTPIYLGTTQFLILTDYPSMTTYIDSVAPQTQLYVIHQTSSRQINPPSSCHVPSASNTLFWYSITNQRSMLDRSHKNPQTYIPR